MNYKDLKDSEFCKAYLAANCRIRQAAEILNIPKSTFYDWLKNNRDFVNWTKSNYLTNRPLDQIKEQCSNHIPGLNQ